MDWRNKKMQFDSLEFVFGSTREVPEILMNIGGNSYDLTYALKQTEILQMIHSIRDFIGACFIVFTLIDLVKYGVNLLDGEFYGSGVHIYATEDAGIDQLYVEGK